MKPINHSKNKTEKCEKKTQYKKKGENSGRTKKVEKKGGSRKGRWGWNYVNF